MLRKVDRLYVVMTITTPDLVLVLCPVILGVLWYMTSLLK